MYHPTATTLLPTLATNTNAAAAATAGRYFTSNANPTIVTATHPNANTILITNNFAQQLPTVPQTHQQHAHHHHQQLMHTHFTAQQQQQQQLQQQQQQQQQQQTHLSALYPQHFAAQHFTAAQPTALSAHPQHAAMLQHFPATSQFYIPAEAAVQTTNTAHMLPTNNLANVTTVSTSTPVAAAATLNGCGGGGGAAKFEGINICINNHHYSDSSTATATLPPPPPPTVALQSQQQLQLSSPIIPHIPNKPNLQHDALRSGLIVDTYNNNDDCILLKDEPDSTTTTPNTPPSTPDTSSATVVATELLAQTIIISPASTSAECNELANEAETNSKADCSMEMPAADVEYIECNSNKSTESAIEAANVAQEEAVNTTTTQTTSQSIFCIDDDVLMKADDGRFYLGTIISATSSEQFLVRFDDRSEVWCSADKMRAIKSVGSNANAAETKQSATCLACKTYQPADVVEVCERCGRGYHRNCTKETSAGSAVWLCKHCVKPMKVAASQVHTNSPSDNFNNCRQLPYHTESLNWDEKHRVNQEQIYCYCGKTGKFDHNMLQCCKCKNWFHTQCMQHFKSQILRGDSFFVFCCSVCNDGKEFLRRLQINLVDVLHLTLYNLSAMRKHQNQKYHHLLKDIWPFLLEKRSMLPIPNEWVAMPQADLMERVKSTLKDNKCRFICGREIKRDHYYYALRNNGPPIAPQFTVHHSDLLTDELLTQKLKLTLLKGAPENISTELEVKTKDVYEFESEDDEKFTSDDEIPIKRIIEKVKLRKNDSETLKEKTQLVNEEKQKIMQDIDENTCSDKLIVTSSSSNSSSSGGIAEEKPKTATVAAAAATTNVRKRKAFAPSKSYDGSRICDSSSDENSSSSRGATLNFIIPPPKDFLGANNPFSVVTPKKNASAIGFSAVGKFIKNSIYNTTTLDLSSKLAALKCAGIYSNISTSELAKAAGQPRTVRTIKRRLSAKDITIGPNQEVRRRRNRRLLSNVEVISSTTINPIAQNLFLVHAKDIFQTHRTAAASHQQQLQAQQSIINSIGSSSLTSTSTPASPPTISSSSSPPASSTSSSDLLPSTQLHDIADKPNIVAAHGRRLRQRPEKKESPNNSRRSSTSSTSTNSNHSLLLTAAPLTAKSTAVASSTSVMSDLKQSVNRYFGAANRIESGEEYCIRAKRKLPNGKVQYLIDWGVSAAKTAGTPASTNT